MTPLVLATVAVLFAAPPTPTPASKDARRVLKDGYQDKLPFEENEAWRGTRVGEGGGRKQTMDPRERSRRAASPRRLQEERGGGGPMGFSALAQALLFGLMALGVGLAIFWVARELTGYQGDAPPRADGEEGDERPRDGPDRAVVERPLGDADELARHGRFGEAIHVLLLRTLQELARRLPERLPSSLTSREIVERVRMPDDARRALSVLVGAVEVSHFGAATPGAAEFQQCRHHFQTFAEAYLRGYA